MKNVHVDGAIRVGEKTKGMFRKAAEHIVDTTILDRHGNKLIGDVRSTMIDVLSMDMAVGAKLQNDRILLGAAVGCSLIVTTYILVGRFRKKRRLRLLLCLAVITCPIMKDKLIF